MKTLTVKKLQNILQKIRSCQPISIDTATEPVFKSIKLRITGLKKIQKMNGLIGFRYENSVNNGLKKEHKKANFKAQARTWGKLDGVLVKHKGKSYLQMKVQNNSLPVYRVGKKHIEYSKIKNLLRLSRTPHTQGKLDKTICVRTVKLENIKAIRMLGERFTVTA